ncbi:MAG: T9SS type A sorting domain-containing protein, partial [Bacteroidia bacterium]
LLSNVTVTNASCGACANGIANMNVVGGVGPYTYTWTPSGGNAPTASNLVPGCYTVVVSDANGCSVSSATCVSFNTGIQSAIVNNMALLVYPNPAKNNVTIEYQGALFNYAIYNNLGQLIASDKDVQNSAVINLNEIARGVYLIEVEIGKDKVRKKLILE